MGEIVPHLVERLEKRSNISKSGMGSGSQDPEVRLDRRLTVRNDGPQTFYRCHGSTEPRLRPVALKENRLFPSIPMTTSRRRDWTSMGLLAVGRREHLHP